MNGQKNEQTDTREIEQMEYLRRNKDLMLLFVNSQGNIGVMFSCIALICTFIMNCYQHTYINFLFCKF